MTLHGLMITLHCSYEMSVLCFLDNTVGDCKGYWCWFRKVLNTNYSFIDIFTLFCPEGARVAAVKRIWHAAL